MVLNLGLSIDNYLGIEQDGMTTIEDWIKQHHNIMKESHDIALHRIEDKAKKRNVRHGGSRSSTATWG